jgi:hypothetical protein
MKTARLTIARNRMIPFLAIEARGARSSDSVKGRAPGESQWSIRINGK